MHFSRFLNDWSFPFQITIDSNPSMPLSLLLSEFARLTGVLAKINKKKSYKFFRKKLQKRNFFKEKASEKL